MAATFTVAAIAPDAGVPENVGHHREVIAEVTVAGTYTTDGDSLPPSKFGLQKILFFVADLNDAGYVPRYVYATEKLEFFKGATGALPQVANAASVAGTFRCRVVGI